MGRPIKERPDGRIEVGGKVYTRDRLLGDLWVASPEELIIGLAMKKLGYTALDRQKFFRSAILSFANSVLEGGEGVEWAAVRRDLDSADGGVLAAIDFAADCIITSPGGIIRG